MGRWRDSWADFISRSTARVAELCTAVAVLGQYMRRVTKGGPYRSLIYLAYDRSLTPLQAYYSPSIHSSLLKLPA